MLDLLQSDQNVRGPHVARQQQLSIDVCCPRPTSAANPPAAAAAVDRRDRQTNRRTDTRPFYDACRILCGSRNKLLPTANAFAELQGLNSCRTGSCFLFRAFKRGLWTCLISWPTFSPYLYNRVWSELTCRNSLSHSHLACSRLSAHIQPSVNNPDTNGAANSVVVSIYNVHELS